MDEKRDTAIVRVAETAMMDITADTVHRYVNQYANPAEIALFLNQCAMFQLNPFKREIYLIKYAAGEPATFVVGYESYLKRAERTGKWSGMETGTTDGPDGRPITAWVKVYRKDWGDRPLFHEVYFSEYCQYRDETRWVNGKKEKTGNRVPTSFWSSKPRTMLKKVAIAQAFRMAFPDELGGMPYMAEEIIAEPERLSTAEIISTDRAGYEAMKARPLGRPKDEFDPGGNEPGTGQNGPVSPEPAKPAPTPAPLKEKPATAQPGPISGHPEPAAKKGPGRPPKAKAEPPAYDPTKDPDSDEFRAPWEDEPADPAMRTEPAPAPAEAVTNANPERLAQLTDAIRKLKGRGVSEEKIYIGLNRNLVANKQMVIAELSDLDDVGCGIALAYINSWRRKLADDQAKAEKEKAGK